MQSLNYVEAYVGEIQFSPLTINHTVSFPLKLSSTETL